MKKSIPKVRERESEASILGNDREREFPLTPDFTSMLKKDIAQEHFLFVAVISGLVDSRSGNILLHISAKQTFVFPGSICRCLQIASGFHPGAGRKSVTNSDIIIYSLYIL